MFLQRGRVCPCCRRVPIVNYRVLCAYCFPAVPFEIRADLNYGYRRRRIEPHLYEEALIRLYVWRNETDMGAIRRETSSD